MEELTKQLERFPSSQVKKAAERLAQGGFIEAAAEPGQSLASESWLQTVGRPARARRLPALNSVCLGQAPAEPIHRELVDSGVKLDRKAPFTVVWCDDYLHSGLREINRRQMEAGRSWALAKPVGDVLWLGPVFQPGAACWECLARRLRTNQPVRQYLALRRPSDAPFLPPQPHSPLSCRVACRLLLGELSDWLASNSSGPPTSLCSFDLAAFVAQRHPVAPWPGCPACGLKPTSAETASSPLSRSEPALTRSEMAERQTRLVSPITGVIRFVRPAARQDRSGIWLSLAANPAARVFEDWSRMKQSLSRCCAGAGTTRREAETAAFCEAIERYSGVFQGCEARRTASFRDLGESAVHPNDCLLFSRRQYRRRQWWNRREADFNWIPRPFREDAAIEWTPLWSLTHRRMRYLPTGMCFYQYPSRRNPFCRPDSNGCAVGPTLEQAAIHGFLELVERDAVAIWWYNRIARPAVDLEQLGAKSAQELARRFGSLDWSLHCLDLTHDFKIPVAAAVLSRPLGRTLRIACGFAARRSMSQAVWKAVCEVSQFAKPFGAEGKPAAGVFEIAREAAGYLSPTSTAPAVEPRAAEGSLEGCLEICRENGLEMLVLDQTRPDAAMPAIKVILPGLRPFWPRFRRGRLFDTPVDMGWLKRARREEELNPIHLNL